MGYSLRRACLCLDWVRLSRVDLNKYADPTSVVTTPTANQSGRFDRALGRGVGAGMTLKAIQERNESAVETRLRRRSRRGDESTKPLLSASPSTESNADTLHLLPAERVRPPNRAARDCRLRILSSSPHLLRPSSDPDSRTRQRPATHSET